MIHRYICDICARRGASQRHGKECAAFPSHHWVELWCLGQHLSSYYRLTQYLFLTAPEGRHSPAGSHCNSVAYHALSTCPAGPTNGRHGGIAPGTCISVEETPRSRISPPRTNVSTTVSSTTVYGALRMMTRFEQQPTQLSKLDWYR